MKKYRIIPFLLAFLLLVQCEDFLDIRPEASLPGVGMDYTKSENIFLSVSAAYAKLRNWGAHVFPYIGAFEIASDNADKGSTPEDNPTMLELDQFTFDSGNSLLNDLWNSYYEIVMGPTTPSIRCLCSWRPC